MSNTTCLDASTPERERYLISVVIPTYRRLECVKKLLLALAQQTLPHAQFEVIVSIDGSDDGTRELVAQFAPSAPYALQGLWQPNRGRAAACNMGIRAAKGELIVLLDDDMDPMPAFLHSHLCAHAGHSNYGVIGAVPFRLNRLSSRTEIYVGTKFNDHLVKLAQPGFSPQLRDFYSGNFSICRALLWEVGLFDEAFKLYGHEDLELSLRLQQAGVQLVYSAQAIAFQSYTKNFAGLAQDNVAKGQTAVLMAYKHPSAIDALKLNSFDAGSWLWRAIRNGLLGACVIGLDPTKILVTLARCLNFWPVRYRHFVYQHVLDYCFWRGVRTALEQFKAPAAMGSVTQARPL